MNLIKPTDLTFSLQEIQGKHSIRKLARSHQQRRNLNIDWMLGIRDLLIFLGVIMILLLCITMQENVLILRRCIMNYLGEYHDVCNFFSNSLAKKPQKTKSVCVLICVYTYSQIKQIQPDCNSHLIWVCSVLPTFLHVCKFLQGKYKGRKKQSSLLESHSSLSHILVVLLSITILSD